MLFQEFLLWLKQRGLLQGITEINVWADDDDGCRELTTEQANRIVHDPIICFYAMDTLHCGQLLVVEAYDPEDMTAGIDYRTWVPITIGIPEYPRVRMICHQPDYGDSGRLARWMTHYGLDVTQLTII